MINEQGLWICCRQVILASHLATAIKPEVLFQFCFHPLTKLSPTYIWTEKPVYLWACSLLPLMASFYPPKHSRCWTGKGLWRVESTSFSDSCQLTLQVFSKVLHCVCGCEEPLCSSRVCEITWNRIESHSGKAIAVGISYVTKPHPGLNDVIYIQVHSTSPKAFCQAQKSDHSIDS